MARILFRLSEAANAVAIYDEAPDGVDPQDINDPMHRPLLDPENWLANIYFHSDFDYCEVAFGPTVVPITHPLVPGATESDGASVNNGQVIYDTTATQYTLLTHNLGYVPDFMVVVDGDALYPGYIAQYFGDGRARYLCAYADSTRIYLEERVSKTSNALSAIAKNYTVLVFKQPPAPSGNVLGSWDGEVLKMGRGKFSSDRRYLQVGSNGDPFGFALGRTIHVKNGAPRFVDPNGTITDPVPAAAAWALAGKGQTSGFIFGPSAAYNGTFTGSPSIEVRAP